MTAADQSGSSVAAVGDVNGDGFADVIVGAPLANPHGIDSGSTYVVFGRAPDAAVTRIGSAANQYISGGPFNDILRGLGGIDTLEGRGGADSHVGGPDSDTVTYLHSPAGVVANLVAPGSNTGDAAGDIYTSIENLIGSPFADKLTGDAKANRITGGLGSDVETGGGGGDTFVLNAVSESPPGPRRDRITDFNAGDAGTRVDRIDLQAIDAKAGPGNQAFTFIGTAEFTHIKGQLRVRRAGTTAIVMGDVNGDAIADFEIALQSFTNLSSLTSIDFKL